MNWSAQGYIVAAPDDHQERSARQVQQDQQQIGLVEQLIAADMLSSTFDQY